MALGGTERILDITPESLHQRTPLLVGSREELTYLRELLMKG